MTIESSSFSNRFHFDLSASFSRSVARESNENGQQHSNSIASDRENYYSRSTSTNLLERALSDGLGKKINLQTNNDPSPAKSIAKNVLSFVRQELRDARSSGASEQELQGLLNQAREGIEQGFASAREALQGRFDSEPRLERQIARAFHRIQHGLERIDNRFTPNVEANSISDQTPAQAPPQSESSNNAVSAGESSQPVIQAQSQLQTTQVEFLKNKRRAAKQ